MRYLRTFRGPSWLLFFLSLDFCYICYFCDICKSFSDIIFSQLFLLRQLRKQFASKFLLTRSILDMNAYIAVLSLQCERLKSELLKSKHDNIVAQLKQQVLKTTARQMTVFSFVISSYQEQLKNEKDAKSSIRDSRSVVQVSQNFKTVNYSVHTVV